jgi:hypothetical protein
MAEKSKLDDNNPIARRDFLRGAGTAVAAGVAPAAGAQAQQPAAGPASEPR